MCTITLNSRAVPVPCMHLSSTSAPAATVAPLGTKPCVAPARRYLSFHTQMRPTNSQRTNASSGNNNNNNNNNNSRNPLEIDTPELLVGDCVALTCFALWKQIAAIVTSPTFPGWLAPLSFNPLRFAEFANFAAMLLASWVVSAALTGGYSSNSACRDVPNAISASCKAWLVSMPVAAAQLVLVTAAESKALVGDEGFASVLPLAASGPGEPLATAAGVLGVMSIWRAFYVVYLDSWNQRDYVLEAQRFRDTVATVAALAAVCSVMLQLLEFAAAGGDGELQAQLGLMADSLWS